MILLTSKNNRINGGEIAWFIYLVFEGKKRTWMEEKEEMPFLFSLPGLFCCHC
jgi:hypothetical protein